LKGPGEEIAQGIEVEKGSQLVGVSFPTFSELGGERQTSWAAVLLVEGDPARVFDRYAQQLAARGIELRPEGPCEEVLPEFPTTRCTAGPSGSTGDARISLSRSEQRHAAWANHLVLAFDPPAPDEPASPSDPAASLPQEAVPAGTDALDNPGPAPQLPEVGEPIAAARELDPLSRPVEVVEGSEMVAPALHDTGGYLAVMRITGDPQEVVDGYADQLGRGELHTDENLEIDGRPVIEKSWGDPDSDTIHVIATTDADGDWYALVRVDDGR
jgi:hypothetical protein